MPAEGQRGPLRVGLVGIGSAATRAHLPALARFEATAAVVLVGVCDPAGARRAAVLADHPQARGFPDNEEMLDSVAPDLLVIATPPSAHLGEIAAAVERGLHVLCEKPLGLAQADVDVLRALADAHSGLTMATVHQYRHARPWGRLAQAATGALREGEPFRIEVAVERPGTDPLSAGGWRVDAEHEGGILGDHAVHYLALLHGLDPGCRVVDCHREGPGGREVASIDVRLGSAGEGRIDVSYAGERRRNVIRLRRPAQCLELAWEDDRLSVMHSDVARPARQVASLSDRAVVNDLYSPMYQELLDNLDDLSWRARATAHTVGVAQLLATALRLAGGQRATTSVSLSTRSLHTG